MPKQRKFSQQAKGGFQDNPQNINKNGRPKKGYSITDWFKKMLKAEPKIRDAIGRSILNKALTGDAAAQRLVWHYMDGMPKQTTQLEGEVKLMGPVIYKPKKKNE